MRTMIRLDQFERGYVEAALWASPDQDNGRPIDSDFSVEDIAGEALEEMIIDCRRFRNMAGDLLEVIKPELAGHDFWLTRNHHGVGFWDRGLGSTGKELTKLTHRFREQFLCAGENGELYLI